MYIKDPIYFENIYKPLEECKKTLHIMVNSSGDKTSDVFDKEITEYVTSYKKSAQYMTDSVFCLGNAPSVSVELELINTDGILNKYVNSCFYIYETVEFWTPSDSEEILNVYDIPIGYFYAYDKPEKYTEKLSLTLNDKMRECGIAYDSKLEYPTTLQLQLNEMSSMIGLSFDTFPTDMDLNQTIGSYDNSFTVRQYLAWIAEANACNIWVNRDGKLQFKRLDGTKIDTTIPLYLLGDLTDEKTKYIISRVYFEDGLNAYEFGTDDNFTLNISADNPYIFNDSTVQNIYNNVQNFTVNSIGDLKLKGDPAIDLGDIISIVDDKGIEKYRFIVLEIEETQNMSSIMQNLAGVIETENKSRIVDTSGFNSKIRSIKVNIDRNNQRIEIVAQEVDKNTQAISQIQLDLDSIELTIKTNKEETDKEFQNFYTKEQIDQFNKDLQGQIDDNITTFFEDGVPTLENYPANEWTTDGQKNSHLGDVYYDNATGKAYRFSYSNNEYVWALIQDSDITYLIEKTAQLVLDVNSITQKVTDVESYTQTSISNFEQQITVIDGKADTANQNAQQAILEAGKAKTVSVTLSKENVSITTDSDGNNGDYSSANTTVYVYYGTENVTAKSSFTVTASQGLTGTWDSTTHTYQVANLTDLNGTVTVEVQYLTFSTSKDFHISKVRRGVDGDAGNGIDTITNYYLASPLDSGVTTSTSGWTTTIQMVDSTNKYLWTYEVTTFTSAQPYTSEPVIIGTYAEQPTQGINLYRKPENETRTKNGITIDVNDGVYHIYGTNTSTSSYNLINFKPIGLTYLELNENEEYTFSLDTEKPIGIEFSIVAYREDGTNFIPCILNRNKNTRFKSFIISSNESYNGDWVGTITIGTNLTTIDYTFRIKIEKGKVNNPTWTPAIEDLQGVGIDSIVEYYLVSENSTGVTHATSGWSTTIPTMTTEKKYLWNYETINYTDGKSEDKEPKVIGAYGDNANIYSVEASTLIMKKSESEGSLTPNSVTFSSYYTSGKDGSKAPYMGRFLIAESQDGINYTTKYTSSANESSKEYTPSSTNIGFIKCFLYASGGTTTQLDSQTVTVLTDLEGITVGGRNLLLNSSFSENLDKWNYTPAHHTIVTKDGFKCVHIVGAFNTYRNIAQELKRILPYVPNTAMCLSGWVKTENIVKGTTNPFLAFYTEGLDENGTWADKNFLTDKYAKDLFTIPQGKWTRVYLVFSLYKNPASLFNFLIYARDFTGDVYVRDVMLEYATTPSDWAPAPEDIETQIDGVVQSLTTVTETVNSVSDRTGTLETTVEGITGQVTSLEETTQQINTKVENFAVGGTNLLVNSNPVNNPDYGGYRYDFASSDINAIKADLIKINNPPIIGISIGFEIISKSSTNNHIVQIAYVLKLNKGVNYTVSAYYKNVTGNGKLSFVIGKDNYVKSDYIDINSTEWKQYSYTFTFDYEEETSYIRFRFLESSVGTFQICGFKLEEGTVATSWSRNPYEALYDNGEIEKNVSENYYTKTQSESLIQSTSKDILLQVSETYATSETVETAITTAQGYTDKQLESYSTTKEMESAIKQSSTSILQEVSVSYVTTETFESQRIGGRNLLFNSSFSDNFDKWNSSGSYANITTKDGFKCAHITGVIGGTKIIQQDLGRILPYEPNTVIAISAWVKIENIVQGTTNPFCSLYTTQQDESNTWINPTVLTNHYATSLFYIPQGKWVKVYRTIKFAKALSVFIFQIYVRDFTGDVYVRDVMLEYATTPSDWAPAPEDLELQIEDIDIGVRNLLLNTKYFDANWMGGGVEENAIGDFSAYYIRRDNFVSGDSRTFMFQSIRRISNLLKAGTYITINGWIYIDGSIPLNNNDLNNIFIRFDKSNSPFTDYANIVFDDFEKDKWVYFEKTAELTDDADEVRDVIFYVAISQNGYVKIAKPQLVIGNKISQDWSPAPEDGVSYTDKKTEEVNAKFELYVDKENMVSYINASADVIELKSNRLIIESDKFKLAQDGTITAINGNFSGTITGSTLIFGDTETKYIRFEVYGRTDSNGVFTPTGLGMNGNGGLYLRNNDDLVEIRNYISSSPSNVLANMTQWDTTLADSTNMAIRTWNYRPDKTLANFVGMQSSYGPEGSTVYWIKNFDTNSICKNKIELTYDPTNELSKISITNVNSSKGSQYSGNYIQFISNSESHMATFANNTPIASGFANSISMNANSTTNFSSFSNAQFNASSYTANSFRLYSDAEYNRLQATNSYQNGKYANELMMDSYSTYGILIFRNKIKSNDKKSNEIYMCGSSGTSGGYIHIDNYALDGSFNRNYIHLDQNGIMLRNYGAADNLQGYIDVNNSANMTLYIQNSLNLTSLNYKVIMTGEYVETRVSHYVSIRNRANTGYAPVYASAFSQQSSIRYKENVNKFGAMDSKIIYKLNPVTFDYKDESMANRKHRVGFIAEEAYDVFPQCVVTNEDGKPDGIDYSQFTPLAIKAIQDLKEEIDMLKIWIDVIEHRLR